MLQSYTPEFKKKIVRLHEEEGRTYKSITAEYGVSKASISKWCSEFSKECQNKALDDPNAYYNYRKHRKSDYYAHKAEVQAQIQEIYHSHNGVDGYRSMKVYLERKGYFYSSTTVHKYL